MEKIVVLNSGGFDSVVLAHYLKNEIINTGDEIHSIHFKYGNRNKRAQLIRVNKVCKKLNLFNHVVTIPKFTWTSSNFYGFKFNDTESQYLEYRNLIFLSYALSLAESIGAKKIYLAILKSYFGYTDTSSDFLQKINELSKLNGIEIIAPFSDYDKIDLRIFSEKYDIKSNEYFSCDVPHFGLFACNECIDCESINEIQGKCDFNSTYNAFVDGGYSPTNKKFKKLFHNEPIYEMRVLINNECQLKCKHCFYGFNETILPILPKEKIYECIEDGIELGIQNFHFSGKEPFFDDTIFWYTSKLQEEHPGITYDAVTNGINVPKYIKQIKDTGMSKIFLSVDEVLGTNGVRQVHGVADKALKALNDYEIPVEVFIDLHENNYEHIGEIVTYLYDTYKVKDFFVRTIRNLGNASEFKMLTPEQIFEVHKQLQQISSRHYSIVFSISKEFYHNLHPEFLLEIQEKDKKHHSFFGTNYYVYTEKYCNRYFDQITLTPDGYILGCASEVSSPNYDEISVGNITDHSLYYLIEEGKNLFNNCPHKMICDKCSFLV